MTYILLFHIPYDSLVSEKLAQLDVSIPQAHGKIRPKKETYPPKEFKNLCLPISATFRKYM